ncbi:MAG: biotin--[acetyl-CoA-carboxylase] ligase, partial [Bacteroidia bacterium]|nr:biotin--[acetyl-CoA-carboxylase] ligase [Bacteroidia bacterium]
SIVGIGINVNQSYFKNNPKATSLSRICGKEFDLETIIVHLSECIEANYLQLKTNKQNLIDTNYLKVLYRLNQLATYKVENSLIEATIIGVSSAGLLQVKFADDTIIEFDFKKIEFI